MDCTDSLRATIARHLAGFSVNRADDTGVRAAAVAVAVTDECFGADLEGMPRHAERRPGAALILTRRSSKLRSHPGQWALPGGRIDPGETPEQTAFYDDLFKKVTQTAEYKEYMEKQALKPVYINGKDMLKFLEEDDALNKSLMTEAGFVAK